MFRITLFVLGTSAALSSIPVLAQDGAKSGRGFNPKISLILQGTYADFSSQLPADVPGVLLGPETELRPAGFSLAESELVIEANVDDQFHAWATAALENEDGETVVAVEEAYINTLALPAGLALKFGRYFSDIGYQNRIHSHAWEFVDLPLVYRALLANQVNDDGVQLRWVAPTDLFLEFGAEALRGQEYPAGGSMRDGVNSFATFAHIGGDFGAGHDWRVGFSHLQADAEDRRTGEGTETSFTGDSDVRILDLVYKWAPDGNPAQRNFVFNAEFFFREEEGAVVFDPDALPAPAAVSAYQGEQKGFYAQGVYQFMPRWRAGVRYDQLDPDNAVADNSSGEFNLLADNSRSRRVSAMADFSNSEFSRIRVQFNRDESRPGGVHDSQVFVQYIMSLGAHVAHQF